MADDDRRPCRAGLEEVSPRSGRAGAGLVPLRRLRIGRRPLVGPDGDTGRGALFGSELHVAPGEAPVLLTMTRQRGRSRFAVRAGGAVHTGAWVPRTTTARRLAGHDLAAGVRVVDSTRTSAVVQGGDTRLVLRRAGLTAIEAARVDGGAAVARFLACPRPRAPGSFVEVDPALAQAERDVLAVAMASGLVLLLRPMARVAIVHWFFAWARPSLAPRRVRDRWVAEHAGVPPAGSP